MGYLYIGSYIALPTVFLTLIYGSTIKNDMSEILLIDLILIQNSKFRTKVITYALIRIWDAKFGVGGA
jgi:hypothetical protein